MNALSASSSEKIPFEANPNTPKLRIQNINFSYDQKTVLKNLSFELKKGEILGILAPNGAGKTTLFQILTGLFPIQKGEIYWEGEKLTNILRKNIGVVFQEPSLDKNLFAYENLILSASLYRVPFQKAKERAHELLDFMDLRTQANDLVKTFSGGMKRRLEMIRALIHEPSLLILDEPTSGLDERGFQKIWKKLKEAQKEKNLSILLNTHRIDEGEKCDRLLILDQGKIIADDSPENLKRKIKGDIIFAKTKDPQGVLDQLKQKFSITGQLTKQKILHLEMKDGASFIPIIVQSFPEKTFDSISLNRPTLADVFLHLTGKSFDEKGISP